MGKLKFRDDTVALENLSRASAAVEDFCASHPGDLSEDEHRELRGLLSDRAAALSKATGLNICSPFDD